ncbi:UDP-forming cellulose synthase catalytic subunit [Candidatus Igneacidithiobacillus taiwanensis]|uniref:UDP-forming cellulose synthase catalytic subunit n=1 Tax=Candidatus Igneacidithiobacillus taiwanensis TaxID=1945924 RepID=UPI00289C01D0|nr:UDP-forming cellulose synthase catalytic subunit [Candidatus Igneacidithiobacillus taiwanensis]
MGKERPNRSLAPVVAVMAVMVLAGALLIGIDLVIVPLDWHRQALLAVSIFLAALFINKHLKAHWATLLLIGISILLTTRYAYWRVTETLGFGDPRYHWYDTVVTLILLAAEIYAWLTLLLGYFQTIWPLQRKPVPLPLDSSLWPDVDVFIPTYNEPIEVVRPTVLGAINMDWPKDKLHVYILDDGSRENFRDFAANVGVGYITREKHDHAKAGNLNHAMTVTHGAYVAIFDCDHIPARSFLQITMGWMVRDSNLALVQTPHHFYSPDPFEYNLGMFRVVPNEGELFYGIVQDGNDLWDATFFCGSCAVIRRTALDEVGGIAVETVTEDAHTALKLQRRGWRTAYLNIPQAAGLATESLSGHIGQRIRWARGMAQIFRVDNPLLGRGLNIGQRLCYLNAMMHFFFALPRLIFLTAPLAYLLFGFRVLDAYAVTFAAYSLPHLFMANLVNSRIQGRHRYSYWNEVYETVLATYILLPVWLAVINPKLGKFNVTAKGGIKEHDYFDGTIAKPYIILWLLNLAGLVAAVLRLTLEVEPRVTTILMTSLWTLYNLMIIGVAIAVSRERRQLRNHVRIPIQLPAFIIISGSLVLKAMTYDLSDGGAKLLLESARNLPADPGLTLRLFWDGDSFDFPIRVVAQKEERLQVAFTPLTIAQQTNLVRLLYTRADAWIGWGGTRDEDRPLASLLLVTKLSWKGVAIMWQWILSGVWRIAQALLVLSVVGLYALGYTQGGQAQAAVLPNDNDSASQITATTKSSSAAPDTQQGAGSFTHTFTLASLGFTKGLRLTGTQGEQTVFLNVPGNEVVRSAIVQMRFRYSPGLLARISQINLLLNGSVIGSFPIPTNAVPGQLQTVTFSVNPFQIVTYNHFTFQLIGHYTLQCEDPANSTLWADILPSTEIALGGTLLDLPDRLSLLPEPFYYQAGQGRVTIPFFLPSGNDSPRVMEAAGVVASWFGTLSNYRTVRFPTSLTSLPQGNVVVFINTAHGIPSSLAGVTLPSPTGPTIAVRTNPTDPSGKILIIMGNNGAQVLRAARALVLGQYALGGDTAVIKNLKMPQRSAPDDAPRWINTTTPTRIGRFTSGKSLQVAYIGSVRVQYCTPPDLFFWNVKNIPLHLRYTYNPGPIGPQSSLVVNSNNQFVSGIALPGGKSRASTVRERTVEIPTADIAPLDNSLNFFFGFQVAKEGPCKDVMPNTLRGAILPDSELDFAGIPHFTRLPNLALLANGGYPFTRYADLEQTAVVLPSTPTAGSVETYLNLLGQFGAQTGYPALRVTVLPPGKTKSAKGKNLIVIGTPGDQPLYSSWAAFLPLVINSDGSVRVNDLRGLFSQMLADLPWWDTQPKQGSLGAKGLGEMLSSGENPEAVIDEIISPLDHNRVALFLEAGEANDYGKLNTTLFDPSHRADIFGNVSVLTDNRSDPLRSFVLPAPHFYLGHLPWWTWLLWTLSRNVWLMVLLVLLTSLAVAMPLTGWLRSKAKKRLAERGEK